MFDFIRRWFGEGTIRFEFTDQTGKQFVGKVPYTGDIDTLEPQELRQEISDQWLVKTGLRIVDFKIIGHCR